MMAAAAPAAFGLARGPVRWKGDRGGGAASARFGTAARELAGLGSQGRRNRLPGRSLILQPIHMELDNYPVFRACGQHPHCGGALNGFSHGETDPCLSKDAGFPFGPRGACGCWLPGKTSARELAALREEDFSGRRHLYMTAEKTLEFAGAISAAVARHEARRSGRLEDQEEAGLDGAQDAALMGWIRETGSTFDEALAEIRETARWFEKVGRLGYGVHAWY